LAAGRVIVREEEGTLALSSFRFLPLGGQAALGAKQPILCTLRVACVPIRFAGAPQRERHVVVLFRLLKQGCRTIQSRSSLGRIPLEQEDVAGEPRPGGQQCGVGDVMLVRFVVHRERDHPRPGQMCLDLACDFVATFVYLPASSRRAGSFINPAMISTTSQPKKWAITPPEGIPIDFGNEGQTTGTGGRGI